MKGHLNATSVGIKKKWFLYQVLVVLMENEKTIKYKEPEKCTCPICGSVHNKKIRRKVDVVRDRLEKDDKIKKLTGD